MALRIACDLDGTLADMEAALQREVEMLFGAEVDLRGGSTLPLAPLQSPSGFDAPTDAPAAPVPAARRPLTDRERRKLWSHVATIENFWRGLREIEPGAVARLAAVAAAHRWEVIFLTQRPGGAGDTAQRQSQEWLRANGFELPSVFVMNGSRGKVADAFALDAVVDDRPDNCLDVVTDSTARALLVWRDEPGTVPPGAKRTGITVVSGFNEALDQLERLTAQRQKPESVLGRVRNAIGI
jgi:hypothetical protein